jgi:hypothetical protein
MSFGKYKGVHICDIPTYYLEWLIDNVEFADGRLERAIEQELKSRPDGPPPPPPRPAADLGPIVRAWYRRLAMRYHPDRNPGDPSAAAKFIAIREAYELLKELLAEGGIRCSE